MEDKTQYEALMEELQKIANNITDVFTELGDTLAKILPDVEIPDEEEDTWEMKCPYKYGGYHWVVYDDGEIGGEKWVDSLEDDGRFLQGNIFQTEQAAELEAKRRNLLTRFRAFRDECNGGWKPDWSDSFKSKYYLVIIDSKVVLDSVNYANRIATFSYFKNEQDAERAIELFGEEIKELFVDCEV